MVAVTIGVLGPSATKVFFYPTLPLTRCINVGETLQGVELFVYPLWLMFAYTITALSFTLAVSAVTGLWPRLPRLYASLGLGSVVLIPALALPNIYTVTHLFSATCYCLSLPFYLALPLAAAAVKIKKQRKRK